MVLTGEDLVLNVNTGTAATPAWTPVNDMNTYRKRKNRDSTKYPVFMRAVPYEVKGARSHDYTLSGYLNDDDPGQQALRNAETASAPVEVQVLPNGTDGFRQMVTVGTTEHGAEVEGLQAYSFEFTGVEEAVVVGLGPIL